MRKNKSNYRKVAINKETAEALKAQFRAFREKFGRDPGPEDPIFFDPDADEPRPYPEDKMIQKTVEGMSKAGISPVLQHAFRTTGILLTADNRHLFSREQLQQWNEAIDEYHRSSEPQTGK